MTRTWLAWLTAVALSVALVACSKTRDPRLDDPADNYGRTIKKQVKEFVANAKQNPKTLPQEAPVLLETLEAHPSAPVGTYKPTYESLTQKCKTLVDASKKSTSSGEVAKLLQDIDTLANQLPGDAGPAAPQAAPSAG
jgi:hypothetical protein